MFRFFHLYIIFSPSNTGISPGRGNWNAANRNGDFSGNDSDMDFEGGRPQLKGH